MVWWTRWTRWSAVGCVAILAVAGTYVFIRYGYHWSIKAAVAVAAIAAAFVIAAGQRWADGDNRWAEADSPAVGCPSRRQSRINRDFACDDPSSLLGFPVLEGVLVRLKWLRWLRCPSSKMRRSTL
jgi:hypothetical protein